MSANVKILVNVLYGGTVIYVCGVGYARFGKIAIEGAHHAKLDMIGMVVISGVMGSKG